MDNHDVEAIERLLCSKAEGKICIFKCQLQDFFFNSPYDFPYDTTSFSAEFLLHITISPEGIRSSGSRKGGCGSRKNSGFFPTWEWDSCSVARYGIIGPSWRILKSTSAQCARRLKFGTLL